LQTQTNRKPTPRTARTRKSGSSRVNLTGSMVVRWSMSASLVYNDGSVYRERAVSFLIRYTFTMEDGEVVHDETVVGDVRELEAIEKDVWVLGQRGTLRVAFDPPLAPRAPVEAEQAA
jgi:hypothetical protein